MDSLKGFGELGLASRLKRISENLMKEIQLVYDHYEIDFDPYLFPVFKVIEQAEKISNSEITSKLQLTQPAVTQTVHRLVKKELVRLEVDKKDKRKKWIALSKKGKQLTKQLKPLWTVIDSVVTQYTMHQSHSLIDQLNMFESHLERQSLSQMIIAKSSLPKKDLTEIVGYSPELKSYFLEYNIEWLETFFYVEDYDQEILGNPEKYILNKGGHIFFIKYNEKVVGTVALMPTNNNGEYELTKLAMSPKYQGLKLGQKLMQHCIDFAKQNKFDTLMLYSNTKLHNSLYIFRKYGFTDVPVEEGSPYARGNVKMTYKL